MDNDTDRLFHALPNRGTELFSLLSSLSRRKSPKLVNTGMATATHPLPLSTRYSVHHRAHSTAAHTMHTRSPARQTEVPERTSEQHDQTQHERCSACQQQLESIKNLMSRCQPFQLAMARPCCCRWLRRAVPRTMEEVDPTRSGECLFRCVACVCVAVASVRCSWQRSSPFPRRSRLAQSGDPLLSQLPKDFLALLSEGASSNDLPRKLEARRRELRDLQDRSAVCRRARCDALHATREALARYCVTAQQQLRLRFARYVLMLALASHCASANSLSAHGTATINMRASLLWLSTSSC